MESNPDLFGQRMREHIPYLLVSLIFLILATLGSVFDWPILRAAAHLLAVATVAVQVLRFFKFGSYEFLFFSFALLYNYQFSVDAFVVTLPLWTRYGNTATPFPDNSIGIFLLFLYQTYLTYLVLLPRRTNPPLKIDRSSYQSAIVATSLLSFLLIVMFFRNTSLMDYLSLNKIEKSAKSLPFIEYKISSCLTFFLLMTNKKHKTVVTLLGWSSVLFALGFDLISGQRELMVLFLIIGLLNLNREEIKIPLVKSLSAGVFVFAFLAYIKHVYPYLSYFFLGKETKWTVNLSRYFSDIFLQGEFSANFVLFYKYNELVNAGEILVKDLSSYVNSFLPFMGRFGSDHFGSVGSQVKAYLDIWSGLASGPYLYPYSVGGFLGVGAAYAVLFALSEVIRTGFYRSKNFFWRAFFFIFAPTIIFFHFRNELAFLFKTSYLALANIALIFLLIWFVRQGLRTTKTIVRTIV
jgi:hypothetical protein